MADTNLTNNYVYDRHLEMEIHKSIKRYIKVIGNPFHRCTHLINSVFLVGLIVVDFNKLYSVLIAVIIDLLHLIQNTLGGLIAIVICI